MIFYFQHGLCVVDSRETFNALTNWLVDARSLASPNIVIILVGNKKDLDAEREVTFLEASRFAQENGQFTVHCVFTTFQYYIAYIFTAFQGLETWFFF